MTKAKLFFLVLMTIHFGTVSSQNGVQKLVVDFGANEKVDFSIQVSNVLKEIKGYRMGGENSVILITGITFPVSSSVTTGVFFAIRYEDGTLAEGKVDIRFDDENWKSVSSDIHDPKNENLLTWGSSLFHLENEETVFDLRITVKENVLINAIDLYFITHEIDSIEKSEKGMLPAPTGGSGSCGCAQPSYFTRAQWGAANSGTQTCFPFINAEPITHLIVHHEGAGSTTSTNWATRAFNIWSYHMNHPTIPYCDVAYNWMLGADGTLYEGRFGSGNQNVQGAHMCGQHENKLGVCVMGDWSNTTLPQVAANKLEELLAWKACEFGIDPNGSGATTSYSGWMQNISGHRDGCGPNYTACPGNGIYGDLSSVRNGVANSSCMNSICTYSLDQSTTLFTSTGGVGSVNLTTSNTCVWEASESCAWINLVSGTSGTGNGTVSISVDENLTVFQRSCTLMIGGESYTVIQEPIQCVYFISETSSFIPSSGGGDDFEVNVANSCSWEVSSPCSWVTITSGASGVGNGMVTFSVNTNSSTQTRTCTLTIENQTFTITQPGLDCFYSLSTNSQTVSSTNLMATFDIATNGGCPWQVSENCGWISVTSSGSGTGSAMIQLEIGANLQQASRSCNILAAGQLHELTQLGICNPPVVVPEVALNGCELSSPYVSGISYQWFLSGSEVGSASRFHSVANSGTYYLEVENQNGCSAQSEEMFVYSDGSNCSLTNPNGLAERNTSEITIFPNPHQGMFTLTIPGLTRQIEYRIHDVLGQLVQFGKCNAESTQIDMSTKSEGVYSLRIAFENGTSSTDRILLTKK